MDSTLYQLVIACAQADTELKQLRHYIAELEAKLKEKEPDGRSAD